QCAILAENPGNSAVQGVGDVGDQHRVYISPQHIGHAGKRMRKGAKVLSLKAGRINQANTLVDGRTILEKRFPAVNNYIVAALDETRREFDKKGFCPAVGGRYSAAAEDGNAKLAISICFSLCLAAHS